MALKILVTDGQNKNTLAILRDLGRDNQKYHLEITSTFNKVITLSAYSKYCRKTHVLSVASEDIDSYAEKLLDLTKERTYDVLLPVGLWSYLATSKFKDRFSKYIHLVVPDWDKMRIAFNKDRTMKFAEDLGIPTPTTITISTDDDLEDICEFPVVMKSSDGFLRYCNNRSDLIKNFEVLQNKTNTKIIVQEYITGFGCGFYGVYDQGKLIAHFLHKRLWEFPQTGGPSAIAESYFDERLLNYGKRLCDALDWNGPVMVEFKYDAEKDDYKLIEINPKLWGSLDLTIAAGVDVPRLLVDIAIGENPEFLGKYKYIKYKWLFPDSFWALISDFSLANLKEFLSRDECDHTNFYSDDVLPFVIQFLRAIAESPMIMFNPRRKYPHGIVRI